MHLEPNSTATVATPAIEPGPDAAQAPAALPPIVRLRGPLITDSAWITPQIDLHEARLRGELLGRAYDAVLEESDVTCRCAMAELIAVAERLRPIATLDGRLDARAAGLLLECVPLSMSTAEREQAAIYLGLLPAIPAPDGIPAAA